MNALTKNWQTTLAGLLYIAIGALNTFAGVHIPGFDVGFGAALVPGIGLILGQDALNAAVKK